MRTFIYARVSTDDQAPQNQVIEIQAAGFAVEKKRIITEHISGNVAASARPQFVNCSRPVGERRAQRSMGVDASGIDSLMCPQGAELFCKHSRDRSTIQPHRQVGPFFDAEPL